VIGVLALQGAVRPHRPHVEAAGAEFRPVRTPAEFEAVDAFILPGGESTTMLKLIDEFGLDTPLRAQFAAKPVWGVCAGAILMASTVAGRDQKSFDLLPMTVSRNAYGRQLQSIQTAIAGYPVSFIRAPAIDAVGEGVEVLAERDGKPVWVRRGPYMATCFHAELTLDFPSPMHRAFVDLAAGPTG
jgi:5'-phosphate synthase pdxT subunit